MLATKNLKLWLPMEGNANDASGNSNDGTVNGATLTTGKFGQCYSFDGDDDYISVNDVLGDIASATTGSICLWVNIDTDDGNENDIFTITNNAVGFNTELRLRFDMRTDSNRIGVGIEVDDEPAWSAYSPDGVLDSYVGNWVHITIVHDGTEAKIYFNAVSQSLTWPVDIDRTKWFKALLTDATTKSNVATLGLLKRDGSDLAPFDGLIDNPMIFSKALSQADIKRVMLGLHPLNG